MNISGETRVELILWNGIMEALDGAYKRNFIAQEQLYIVNAAKLASPNMDTAAETIKISRIQFSKTFFSHRIEEAVIKSADKYIKPIKSGMLVIIFFENTQENKLNIINKPSAIRILASGKRAFLKVSA
ncbi:MAG: hypothetical protein NTX75_09385 [Proteobacteria bacterium]|nr:hypothetical protein [Pseudomonadota bacterium]